MLTYNRLKTVAVTRRYNNSGGATPVNKRRLTRFTSGAEREYVVYFSGEFDPNTSSEENMVGPKKPCVGAFLNEPWGRGYSFHA